MNAVDGVQRLLLVAGHPRPAQELPEGLPRLSSPPESGRVRPRDRRGAGHRSGRHGRRGPRRSVPLRDDSRVRRPLTARKNRDARLRRRCGDQQVRALRRGRRGARGRARDPGTRKTSVRVPRRCRSSAPACNVQRQRGHGLYQDLSRDGWRARTAARRGALPQAMAKSSTERRVDRPACQGRLPRRDRRDRTGLSREDRRADLCGAAGQRLAAVRSRLFSDSELTA